jgi:uncharacterized protein
MHTRRPLTSYGAELRCIAGQAAAALGGLPYARRGARLDSALARGGIFVLAPFLFAEALPFDGSLGRARTIALANAFGAAHFLVQDRILDGDEAPSPEACHFSDLALSLFLKELGRLFDAASPFWQHLERYLGEYFESLAWERAVLRTEDGRGAVEPEALDASLLELGRRLSPLKTTAAGIALLAGREDRLGAMETIIEDYHAAYQLADDLEDLVDDARAGRWSVPIWMIVRRAGLDSPPSGVGGDDLARLAVETRVLDDVAALIGDRYARARAAAVDLGAGSLASHLGQLRDDALCLLRWNARRGLIALRAGTPAGALAIPRVHADDGAAPRPRLHAFEVAGDGFVLDPGSCLFFQADRAAVEVLGQLERDASDSDIAVLGMNHGPAVVDEILDEVFALIPVADDERSAGPPSSAAVVSLALHVSERCNLSCDYCYLSAGDAGALMSEDVALRALDVLFDESFGAPRLSVVFFGGEPLLHLDLIETVAERARERAAAEGRIVSFHVTTNGTLLTPDVASRLAAIDAAVLVSVDGDRAGHDAHRRFHDGAGSYDVIASNAARFPSGFAAGARATVTEASPPLVDLTRHLSGLGFTSVHLSPVSGFPLSPAFATRLCGEYEALARFELENVRAGRAPVVGNFVEGVLALDSGTPRRLPCGAGARYLSVSADGTLSLCHRFAGNAAFAVGDVAGGFDREAVAGILGGLSTRAAECGRCWARWLCGGPCFFDLTASPGDAVGERAPRCRIRRRVLELSMWLYTALPAHVRERVAAVARRAGRPEVLACDEARGRTRGGNGFVRGARPAELPHGEEGGGDGGTSQAGEQARATGLASRSGAAE